MGLDMYLNGKRYLWSFKETESALAKEIGKLVGIESQEVKTVTIEAAYWRKANEIHCWFVENIQEGDDNCEEYEVSRDQLKELVSVCEKVLADPSKAEELLPTRAGFFFGGTDYDKYYFDGLKNTIETLNKVIALPNEWYFTYQSSW